jgi:hypothetical protein
MEQVYIKRAIFITSDAASLIARPQYTIDDSCNSLTGFDQFGGLLACWEMVILVIVLGQVEEFQRQVTNFCD